MACAGCTVCGTGDGKTKGCQSGGWASGGCDRPKTYDWGFGGRRCGFSPFLNVEEIF